MTTSTYMKPVLNLTSMDINIVINYQRPGTPMSVLWESASSEKKNKRVKICQDVSRFISQDLSIFGHRIEPIFGEICQDVSTAISPELR